MRSGRTASFALNKLFKQGSSPAMQAAGFMKLPKNISCVVVALGAIIRCEAADFDLAATATNELGIDLHRQLATADENLCLSPYSVQIALAMTYAGADGATRPEMARVLHYPADGDAIHPSFAALQRSLEEMARKTITIAERSKESGGPSEPITLAIADRLFPQTGYSFRDPFRALIAKYYAARFSRSIFAIMRITRASTSTSGWLSKRATEFAI
jgi:serine protease inhibitor